MLFLLLIRIGVTIGAIALVYKCAALDRAGRPLRGTWPELLLFNLALVSVALYLGFTVAPKPTVHVHEHDIFHYYMGSKYSREVGYMDLYFCAAVAHSENAPDAKREFRIRRMDDYGFVASRNVFARGDTYRALFSESRWREFKADVAFFQSKMGDKRWYSLFKDNGYNATPVWNMVARALTNTVSVRSALGLPLLASVDPLLLALMFVVVWRAFGSRTALLGIVFLGTLFPMAPDTIRGAFQRLDWCALLVMALCVLKMRHYKTAGALMAYAGMARIFPLAFVFGLGAKAVWDLIATRRIDRRYLQFFVVFGVVVAVLFGVSLISDGGTARWESFVAKIRFHDQHMSMYRVGFKPLLLAGAGLVVSDWPSSPTERAYRFDDVQVVWWLVQALVLCGAFLAARGLEDWETLALGYVVVYFLAAPTYYYQVMLLVPAMLFLPRLREGPRTHGIALLLGISIVGYLLWIQRNLGTDGSDTPWQIAGWRRLDYSITLSLDAMLLVFSLYVLGYCLYRSLRGGVEERLENA